MTIEREVLDRLETIKQRPARLEHEIRRGFAQANQRLTATEARLAALEMRLSDGAAETATSPDRV